MGKLGLVIQLYQNDNDEDGNFVPKIVEEPETNIVEDENRGI